MVVYKFYKDNCPPCYSMSRLLNHIGVPNENVKLINVNVDVEENKDLVTHYNVDNVPTLISENGNRLTGLKSKIELEKFLTVLS